MAQVHFITRLCLCICLPPRAVGLSYFATMTEVEATPINIETGLEGREVQSFDSMDKEKQEMLKWARPQFFLEIDWKKRFTEAEVDFTSLGKPPLATNVVKLRPSSVIKVQFPEATFPFGVDFGKKAGDKPGLGMAFSGPLGEAVIESYTQGDFFQGLHAFMQKHVCSMWPEKAGINIDLNMMPFLLTKNTCKVREVFDKKDETKSHKVLNAKFYCIRNQLEAKITKVTPEKKQEIVAINSVRPGSRGIVSARIQQLPYKDTLAVTIEIMELVITHEPPERTEVANTREDLNKTSMIDLGAEEAFLKKRAAVEEPEAVKTAQPKKKVKKDSF